MAEPQPERRSSRRFALRLPLTVTYRTDLRTVWSRKAATLAPRYLLLF